MPTSLRNLAVLHSAALVVLLAVGLGAARLPWFALLSVLFLGPLGPLLFLNRPLMWRLARYAAYGYAFLAGVWLMYGVLGLDSIGDLVRSVLLGLLAFYFIGVGGYLKSERPRAWFRVPSDSPAA